MGRYRKRKDGRYATTVMIGYKADGRANNVFLSAKTEKELRDKVAELKCKANIGKLVKESDMLLHDYVDGSTPIRPLQESIPARCTITP